jgi:hypothetical protein
MPPISTFPRIDRLEAPVLSTGEKVVGRRTSCNIPRENIWLHPAVEAVGMGSERQVHVKSDTGSLRGLHEIFDLISQNPLAVKVKISEFLRKGAVRDRGIPQVLRPVRPGEAGVFKYCSKSSVLFAFRYSVQIGLKRWILSASSVEKRMAQEFEDTVLLSSLFLIVDPGLTSQLLYPCPIFSRSVEAAGFEATVPVGRPCKVDVKLIPKFTAERRVRTRFTRRF